MTHHPDHRGRCAARLLLLLAGLLLVVGPAGTATAREAGDRVEFSRDGSPWRSTLGQPLLDPEVRWVPGDVRTESLRVRHTGPTAADLRVEVVGLADTTLLDEGLRIAARLGRGPWRDLTGPRIVRRNVAPREAVRVRLRVQLPEKATNAAMTQTAAFDLRFVVTESLRMGGGGVVGPNAPGTGSPGAGGPGTGPVTDGPVTDPRSPDRSGEVPTAIAAGLAELFVGEDGAVRGSMLLASSLALGVLLVLARRRRSRVEH